MWPVCINNLSPGKYQVNEEITELLKDAFKKALKAQGKLSNCEWVDFDIIDANHQSLPLRMVFNWGDGDCNDGFWGAVWERNTEELVANISSTGDCETTIEAVSKQYIDRYQSQETLIPIDDSYKLEFDNPELTSASEMWDISFFIVYANKLEIYQSHIEMR